MHSNLFGALLNKHRIAAEITLRDGARLLGLDVIALSKIERGVDAPCGCHETLDRWAGQLNLSDEDRMGFHAAAARAALDGPRGSPTEAEIDSCMPAFPRFIKSEASLQAFRATVREALTPTRSAHDHSAQKQHLAAVG